MQNPLVSIIVPIYNVEKYLSECLESLVGQSYANLDIILIDDGSSDKSLEIALNYAKKDERIFVVSKQNGGQASARNFGLEFIKGTNLRAFFENLNFVNLKNAAKNLNKFNDKKALNLSKNDRKSEISQKNSTQNAENSRFKSLVQTHSFEKRGKFINESEIRSHFTQLGVNFVKSDLKNISDFVVQKLPKNALVHFVDSDDVLEISCIEKCVKALQNGDLLLHANAEFSENLSEVKQGSYIKKFKQNVAESGLELLLQNRIFDLYFAWQGLFRAHILNRYALRFSEGIYHEDHEFGILLFALAGRVLLTREPLYFYRQRANSTMTSQRQSTFPPHLPSFLAPLKPYFKDYKALREYFKAYCFVRVGLRIWEFYQKSSQIDKNFAKSYQNFFIKSSLNCMKIFKISLKNDPLNIKNLLKKLNFPPSFVLKEFFKGIYRHPKKLKYAQNLKYLLSKEKK